MKVASDDFFQGFTAWNSNIKIKILKVLWQDMSILKSHCLVLAS